MTKIQVHRPQCVAETSLGAIAMMNTATLTIDVSADHDGSAECSCTRCSARTNRKRFYHEYALWYAFKSLRPRGGKAKANHGATVRGDRTSGGLSRPSRRQDGKKWKLWAEFIAEELAQDAALRWTVADRAGQPIDTRTAIRDAVREYRRSSRQRSPARRCESCRYKKVRCEVCDRKHAESCENWSRMNKPTALSSETRDTLSTVAARPEPTVEDLITFALRPQMIILLRMLASGSSQKDVAEFLSGWRVVSLANGVETRDRLPGSQNVSPMAIQRLLKKLRTLYTAADFSGPMIGATYPLTGRVYGDRPGSATHDNGWIGHLANLMDQEHGHISPHHEVTEVVEGMRHVPMMPTNTDSMDRVHSLAMQSETQESLDIASALLDQSVVVPLYGPGESPYPQ